MSTPAIAVCCVLYIVAAVDYWQSGQRGLALAFACYALANIGLILAAKKI